MASYSPNMSAKRAILQLQILRVFGFLPFSREKHDSFRSVEALLEPDKISVCSRQSRLRFLQTVIFSTVMTGFFAWFLVAFGQFMTFIIPNNTVNLLVRVFLAIPYSTMIFRNIAVLAIAFWKKPKFSQLIDDSEHLIHVSSNQGLHFTRKTCQDFGASLGNLILPVFVAVGLMVGYMVIISEFYPEITIFSVYTIFIPWPVELPFWAYFFCWLISYGWSFVLTQQAVAILLVFADVIFCALREVNRDILAVSATLADGPWENGLTKTVEGKLGLWKEVYLYGHIFRNRLNAYFNLMMTVLFCFDFLTMLGFGTNIIMNFNPTVKSYAYYLVAAVFFSMNVTVFLAPLILAYEQSLYVSINMLRLIDLFDQTTLKDGELKRQALVKQLSRFEQSVRLQPCSFHGAHVLHFTRAFALATYTLVLSLLVLAKELLDREHDMKAQVTVPGHNMSEISDHQ